jgi:hypothetical protein
LLLLPILSFLPIKLVEAPFIVINVEVVDLQIPITPKFVPLAVPQIGVSVKIIMIDTALHAFEIFRTPKKVLKDTHVIEKPKLEPSTLVEHADVSK